MGAERQLTTKWSISERLTFSSNVSVVLLNDAVRPFFDSLCSCACYKHVPPTQGCFCWVFFYFNTTTTTTPIAHNATTPHLSLSLTEAHTSVRGHIDQRPFTTTNHMRANNSPARARAKPPSCLCHRHKNTSRVVHSLCGAVGTSVGAQRHSNSPPIRAICFTSQLPL